MYLLTMWIMNDPNTTNQPQPPSGGPLVTTTAEVFFSGGFFDRILLAIIQPCYCLNVLKLYGISTGNGDEDGNVIQKIHEWVAWIPFMCVYSKRTVFVGRLQHNATCCGQKINYIGYSTVQQWCYHMFCFRRNEIIKSCSFVKPIRFKNPLAKLSYRIDIGNGVRGSWTRWKWWEENINNKIELKNWKIKPIPYESSACADRSGRSTRCWPKAGRLNRKTDRRHGDRVWTDRKNVSAALSPSPFYATTSRPVITGNQPNHVPSRDLGVTRRCALPVRCRGFPYRAPGAGKPKTASNRVEPRPNDYFMNNYNHRFSLSLSFSVPPPAFMTFY